MTGLFSSENAVVLRHIFIYIFIPDRCLRIVDSGFVKCFVQSKVRHYSCNNRIILQFAAFLHILSINVKDRISVYQIALFIYAKTSVSISVISKSDIQSVLYYKLLQSFDMCRAGIVINVRSIRFCIDHISLRSKRIEYGFGKIP